MYKLVVLDGREIYCDTLDELEAAATRFWSPTNGGKNGNGKSQPVMPCGPAPVRSSQWTPARFQRFVQSLNALQEKMLRALIAHPEGLPDATLRELLEIKAIDNRGFGPIIGWMAQRAKKVDLGLLDVVISHRTTLTGPIHFQASPGFVQIAKTAKWPKGELKQKTELKTR
jgi:hypothetical protein